MLPKNITHGINVYLPKFGWFYMVIFRFLLFQSRGSIMRCKDWCRPGSNGVETQNWIYLFPGSCMLRPFLKTGGPPFGSWETFSLRNGATRIHRPFWKNGGQCPDTPGWKNWNPTLFDAILEVDQTCPILILIAWVPLNFQQEHTPKNDISIEMGCTQWSGWFRPTILG